MLWRRPALRSPVRAYEVSGPPAGGLRTGAFQLWLAAVRLPEVLLAALGPEWTWGALLLAGFAALSVLTIALTRYPTQHVPPPLASGPRRRSDKARTEKEAGHMAKVKDWEVVGVAPDQLSGEMWVALLRDSGMPALIRPSDAVSFLGTSALTCRVLVPKTRLAEAANLLKDQLAGGVEGAKNDG